MTIYSTDHEILKTAVDWISAGHRIALVTVAKTWGSSPRPCGSMLVMRDDGIHAGSVSGGCVEEDLLQRYKNDELTDQFPASINYGIDRQEALRFGLPCGGRLELIIVQPESAAQLNTLLEKTNNGELVTLQVCLNTGEISLHNSAHTTEFYYDDNKMVKVFGSSWQMLLIGAGQLSQYVARIALMLNYRVTVCAPKEEYSAGWNIETVTFSHKMPDDAVKEMNNPERCIVLALAHNPKQDDMALMEALDTDMFYVGALGSQRCNEQRLMRLLELGVNREQLAKLHAPVGLAIGSRTPPEIAVAIMAQITAEKNSIKHSHD